MQKRFTFLSLAAASFCIAAFLTPFTAGAGEEGLYPAAPPPGSAFIRFLNGNSAAPASVKMRGKSYGAVSLGEISAYAPVPRGETGLTIGAESATATLKEGAHYTAALIKGKIHVLEEPANDNQLKAQVILINASSLPGIALKTADGATSVIDSVGPEKLGGRPVNAVKAPFAVYAAAKKISDLEPHLLERGERYAVVVYDGANGKPAVTFN